MIVLSVITIFILLITWGEIMAAIDNLNQAITELRTKVDSITVVNNDAAIQAAADNIAAITATLNTKFPAA